jgi:hypothetical protein
VLTRGPGQLSPSDSAPVLQYGSGPSDYQAKILGVDTALFLRNMQLYFSLLHAYIVSFIKGVSSKLSVVVQLVACLPVA